jgi:hypothetical protein
MLAWSLLTLPFSISEGKCCASARDPIQNHDNEPDLVSNRLQYDILWLLKSGHGTPALKKSFWKIFVTSQIQTLKPQWSTTIRTKGRVASNRVPASNLRQLTRTTKATLHLQCPPRCHPPLPLLRSQKPWYCIFQQPLLRLSISVESLNR